MNRPLVLLTACYIAGVLLGGMVNIEPFWAMLAAGLLLLVTTAGYLLAWRETRQVILLLFLLLGLTMSRLAVAQSETPLVEYAGRQVTLIGWIAAEPDVREDKIFYLLQVRELVLGADDNLAVGGTVRLQVKEADRVYAYGDLIQASGLLARPELPGNPGAFNYRTYLGRQGIKVVLMAKGAESLEKIGVNVTNPLLHAALQSKEKLSAAAGTSLTSEQTAVLNGILFGVQGLIDRQTRLAFTETGIVHILSVSGLHVGMVLGGMFGLLRLLRLPPAWSAPLLTPVLIFYALLTGCTPPVVRATIMALLLLWAHHWGRDHDWPTTMALAALVILLWRPLQIYNPGFQLSFAATWGILYLIPFFNNLCAARFERVLSAAWSRALFLTLAVTLAAQLATIPLVAWYYNLISPVSLPANLVVTPLVGLIMLLGFIAAFLGLLWPPLASLLNVSNGLIIDLFLQIVTFFQELPGAVIYLPTPPEVLAAVWYGVLLTTVWLQSGSDLAKRTKERLRGWAVVGLALGVVLLLVFFPWAGGRGLTVHFIDVGQGDCILVQAPGGRNMLIDAGGRRNEFLTGTGTGDQVVTPYLHRIGVRRLDVVAFSHPHEDHAGGGAAVVKNFPVGVAVTPQIEEVKRQLQAGQDAVEASGVAANKRNALEEEVPAPYVDLMKKMAAGGTPVYFAGAGDVIRLDRETTVEVLAPGLAEDSSFSGLNDYSLVLKLTYRQSSFLFTGDLEIYGQSELIRQGADLQADVLKMPHHGSRLLLPALVEQVSPDLAVITVGAYNTFGHPAQFTLDTLNEQGVQVYRTDRDGAVIFQTNGRRLEITTGKSKTAS